MAIGSETNSCFGDGLSWCLRRLGSLFVLLSWLERQNLVLKRLCSHRASLRGTMIRWSHSAAQLGEVFTKSCNTPRAPRELFVRRAFRLKLTHTVPNLTLLRQSCSRCSTRSKECHVDCVKCMTGQFSKPRFRHTCSGLRFLASKTADPELHDASVLVLCMLMHQNS